MATERCRRCGWTHPWDALCSVSEQKKGPDPAHRLATDEARQITRDGSADYWHALDCPMCSWDAFPQVTRITVVDDTDGGKVLERWGIQLRFALQDDERTLKVYIANREAVTPDGK
jgi:hypothetical protein